uniref:Uncharacterized protein n=1 Tax=Anguilla anguilla TaxID=7936 RepID=A0A0E9XMC4_ANGAN
MDCISRRSNCYISTTSCQWRSLHRQSAGVGLHFPWKPVSPSLRSHSVRWGTYRCEADGQHRDISLTVKGKFYHICS